MPEALRHATQFLFGLPDARYNLFSWLRPAKPLAKLKIASIHILKGVMSVSAVKGILWAAIAIAVAMFIVTASVAFNRNESLALYLAGCVLIVSTLRWYRRVIQDAEAREHQIEQMRRVDERLEMLKRVAAETDPAAALQLLDEIDKRFANDPVLERKPRKGLSAVAIARRDALLADLRTVGAGDTAATKRLLEKHANAYAREMTTKLAVSGVALAALVVAVLVLFGE